MRRTSAWIARAVPAAVLLAASFAVAGVEGLVIAADVLAGVLLLAALAGAQAGSARSAGARARQTIWTAWRSRGLGRASAGPSAASRWRRPLTLARNRVARRWSGPDFQSVAGYPAFRRIRSDLTWAGVSLRHYDHSVRPLLTRLLAAALRDRHGVDLGRDPLAARELVGADLWPLVDPSRPPSQDSRAPGVDLRTLTRFVDRLERL